MTKNTTSSAPSEAEIGRSLAEARESAGLTQFEASRALSTTPTTISRWENGVRTPSISSFYALATTYNTTVAQLLPNSQSKGAVADLARVRKGTDGN